MITENPKKKYVAKLTGKTWNSKREAMIDNYNYTVAKKLSEQTRKTPIKYIGGASDKARQEYWLQEPVLQHAVDSIANAYNIDSEVLKSRLNHEGFVDSEIQSRNYDYLNNDEKSIQRGYDLLNSTDYLSGATYFGLDDVGSLINEGKVKLINENWGDEFFINEKNRETSAAAGKTVKDNFGITAATLKYFKDKAKQDFPSASDEDLNRYSLAYFNRGAVGGKKWVKEGAKGYNYRRRLESAGKKSK